MEVKFMALPVEVIMVYNEKTDKLIVNSKVIKPCSEEVLKGIYLLYKDGGIWAK